MIQNMLDSNRQLKRILGFGHRKPVIADQAHPVPGKLVVADQLIQDIQDRVALGEKRYGTKLMTGNGRNALIDAYQEVLDAAFYLCQALMERDGK
jgi:hypothetical protein